MTSIPRAQQRFTDLALKKKKTFTEGEQIIAGVGPLNMLQLFRVVGDKIQEKYQGENSPIAHKKVQSAA